MLAAQKKDRGLKKLFDSYFAHLVIFSAHITNDRKVSEDIVQEVFLNLWQKDLLKSVSINYLYRCTKNASINFLRSKEGKVHISSSSLSTDIKDDEFSIDDEIQKMKELESLYQAIEELPPQCKEVLKKVYLNDLKYAEVAEELNISINTVKTHMFKALKYLRTKFSASTLLYFATFFKMLN